MGAALNTAVTHLFIFTLLFLFADRFSGGGFGWDKLAHANGGPLRGRGIGYAMILALLVIGLTVGWKAGAVAAVAFGIWRSPAWKIAGKGGITPRSKADMAAYFVRHMLAAVAIPLAYAAGLNWQAGLVTVPIFAALSVALGRWHAIETDKGRDTNGTVEMVRGGLFGAMLYAMLA